MKQVFALYETGIWPFNALLEEIDRLGLRNTKGGPVTMTGLSTILHNPFYAGIIKLRKTKETFDGCHQPLITMRQFKNVQDVLTGNRQGRFLVHDFIFRRMFRCALCGYALIGERQKGQVYYRCHTKGCPTSSVREDDLEARVKVLMQSICIGDQEYEILERLLEELRADLVVTQDVSISAKLMEQEAITNRLNRLTDAYVDALIDKSVFDERRSTLICQKHQCEDQISAIKANPQVIADKVAEYLELAKTAYLSYESGMLLEKRELLKSVTSNRSVEGKNVELELRNPFQEIAKTRILLNGAPHRDVPRTGSALIKLLAKIAM